MRAFIDLMQGEFFHDLRIGSRAMDKKHRVLIRVSCHQGQLDSSSHIPVIDLRDQSRR